MIRLGNNGNVRALLLDMGGVLVDLDRERCLRAFTEKAGLTTMKDYIDNCHQRGFFGKYEMGLIDDAELYAECISRSRPGTTPDTIRECIEAMITGIHPAKGPLLRKVSEYCDLYMVSNNNPIALRYCSKLFDEAGIPLDTTFKHLFCSFQMHIGKPSEAFYRKVIDTIGLPPSQMVFVDDSPINVEGAAGFGIDARLYVPGTELSAVLQPVWD